jgi:hypothetical protein
MNGRLFSFVIQVQVLVSFLVGCDRDQRDRRIKAGANDVTMGVDVDDEKASAGERALAGIAKTDDATRSIVFRSQTASAASIVSRTKNSAVLPPMIQGFPEALAVDEDGNQYVGGSFSGERDFNTGLGVDVHRATGKEDGFVSCFGANGKYRWTTTFGAQQRVGVRGIAVSRGTLYVACDELNGHVGILAMDSATGMPNAKFGVSGTKMFRCGQIGRAVAIRCRGEVLYVAVQGVNFPVGQDVACSFVAVLAIDRTSASPIPGFGTNGIQTIGNPVIPAAATPISGIDSVEPFGAAMTNSTLYVVGACQGRSLGIGGRDRSSRSDT